MPRAGGLYATHMLREAGQSCKILLSVEHAFPQLPRMLRAAGCNGYVLKSNLGDDFLRAVRAVLAGEDFFSSRSSSAEENERAAHGVA
jgi:DNA-binding NarL/FixJ family response regulator